MKVKEGWEMPEAPCEGAVACAWWTKEDVGVPCGWCIAWLNWDQSVLVGLFADAPFEMTNPSVTAKDLEAIGFMIV